MKTIFSRQPVAAIAGQFDSGETLVVLKFSERAFPLVDVFDGELYKTVGKTNDTAPAWLLTKGFNLYYGQIRSFKNFEREECEFTKEGVMKELSLCRVHIGQRSLM
ncbi:hypothetical protein GAYE_HTGSCF31FUTG100G0364 [Galdieria yellowstonensis]|uniref:Uncharacterized protein n=1 Tax=Galdieria yellowstonensis TaxID=3028027 RepID=A0AAV9I2T1_9RHOD|nr:hypothetical protein GAYE_HTGSCF31FUTG100G0364 [Galdieria yellowstonensis]